MTIMVSDFDSIFLRLKAILQRQGKGLSVTEDAPGRYCLEGPVGPSTLRAWGGKVKRPLIPVAWVEIKKSCVSYHLVGIYEDPTVQGQMSNALRARMQGWTCFNFKTQDQLALTDELEHLTALALVTLRTAGFITDAESA